MGFSKECTKCGKVKWWYQFNAEKKKYGFSRRSQCRECAAEQNRKNRLENIEKTKDRKRKYRLEHLEKEKERSRKYYSEHLEKEKERGRKYYSEHLEKEKERGRKWYWENLEKAKEQQHKYRLEHLEKEKERGRKYYQNNKAEISLYEKYRFPIPEARKLLNAKLTDVLEFTIPQQTEVRS